MTEGDDVTAPDPRQDLGTFAVIAGDPLTISYTVQANGSPVDLTTIGTTVTSLLRQAPGATPTYSFDMSASVLASGQLVWKLTGTQTAAMMSGNGSTHWYFDTTFTGGTVSPQTPFKGQVVEYRGETNG